MNFLEVMGAIFCFIIAVFWLLFVYGWMLTPRERDGWQDADPRPKERK